MSTVPDVQAFYRRCQSADWHTWAIDDGAQWREASAKHAELQRAACAHPALTAIYNAWHAYTHSGAAYGIPQAPKPECPHALPSCEGQLSIYDVIGD